jgi:hypothetical protein
MSEREYQIVSGVFGNTLPYRVRILITNAAGASGRAFTIPTSLLATIAGVNPATFLASVSLGYLASFINLAYLINVGQSYDLLATSEKNLLVHETAHVWQGKNSTFALSYVFNSVYSQCVRGNAYTYRAGQPWASYNVEQQASIVEDWFATGQPTSGPLYRYITDHVRRGDA